MVAPRGDSSGQEANDSGFRKENLFQRKSERVRFCSRKECRPRHSQRKNPEKQQMGNEYWPGYDDSHSIKKYQIGEVMGTEHLVGGFLMA